MKMNPKRYAVVENAGTDKERVIKRFETFEQADAFATRYYDYEELLNLGVDIMGINDDGMLTTEI